MPSTPEVTITMTRTEALGLIQNTASAERAINAVSEAAARRGKR